MIRISTFAIIALVSLRLLLGWHLFNEGVKKLDPGFTSAGFLGAARGPLGPMFRAMVAGPYRANFDLAMPAELDPEAYAESDAESDEQWGAQWVENIRNGWEDAIDRLAALKEPAVSEDVINGARDAADARIIEVQEYIKSLNEDDEIADLAHEKWRLAQMQEEATYSPAPFFKERIDEKTAEVRRTSRPWIAQVQQIESAFVEDVVALAEADGFEAATVADAMEERTFLRFVDKAVTITILSCGICLFLGAATPIAGTVAALFLLSLMATLPPWTATTELETKEVFLWGIEMLACLVVAALGAGRWAGVDGVCNYMLLRCCGKLPAQSKPATPTAAAA